MPGRGSSGFRVVGALDDEDVARLAPAAVPAIEAAAARESTVTAWARWTEAAALAGGAVPVRRPDGGGTEQAPRLLDMLEDSALDALAADGALPVHA
ncbi:hypothetical protein ACF1AB_35760 [Streptomyces sp. NPDC014846]|uniref:hypothetical protein n=1 Tax=Streptomyces sp. NPDC014846 TaxID=3364922 RepID=UPI0036F7B1F5